jgi:hypothetical protein
MKETRETVVKIVEEMAISGFPFLEALAVCSVPNCVHQYGCPEGKTNCGWFEKNRGDFLYNVKERRYIYFDKQF